MDYKEQIEQAKHAAEKWREKHRIVGVGEFRVDCMVDDLTRSITDLLARAEAAEEQAKYWKSRYEEAVDKVNLSASIIQKADERTREAEERAEKAERERDAAIERLRVDHWCDDCKYGLVSQACRNDGECSACKEPCYCGGCENGKLWAWKELEE